jgi:hypothetical protein
MRITNVPLRTAMLNLVGRLIENMATHAVWNGMNVKLGTIQIFEGTSKQIQCKQRVKQ